MASALDAVRVAIEGQVKDGWKEDAPIQWPGRPWTPPNGPWVQVHVIFGKAGAVTMGTRGTGAGTNQVVGLVNLNIFGPGGKGTGALTRLADAARDLLASLVVEGVQFDEPDGPVAVPAGGERKEQWAQVNVSTTFVVVEGR